MINFEYSRRVKKSEFLSYLRQYGNIKYIKFQLQSLDQFPAVVALRRLRRLTDISRPIVKYSKDVIHYSSNLPLTAIPQVTAKIGNAAHIAEGNQWIEEEQSEETPLPTLFCKVSNPRNRPCTTLQT